MDSLKILIELDNYIEELLKLGVSDIDELRERYKTLKHKIKDLSKVAQLKRTKDLYKGDKYILNYPIQFSS